MMSDNTSRMFPKVETFGQDGPKHEPLHDDSNRPKKRGALAKGRTKNKPPPVSRDHFRSTSEAVTVSREKMKKLQVGQLPKVDVQPATVQTQTEGDQDDVKISGLTLPDILMKHSNLWGKRVKTKRQDRIQLEVAGMDIALPPPRPMSMSRKKKLALTKLTYGNEHAMFKEVEDIKQILHCHVVGMPIEINKTAEESKQVARPIFHCSDCFDFWTNTGELRLECGKTYKPVKGPVILLSSGAAALIKSVWTERGNKPHKTKTENIQPEQEDVNFTKPTDDVNDIINELSDYDDCSVVIEHIAEGIAINAGFEQHVLKAATREVAENLALIISGKKPDDTAMMELIEKYLGETDLMILRGMIEGDNINDMKILKEKPGFDKTQIVNQREKASKLLDRLAILKARDTNGFRNEKVVYLTELFNVRGGQDKNSLDTCLDRRGNMTSPFVGKRESDWEIGQDINLTLESSDDNFEYQNLKEKYDESMMDKRHGRTAGGKYGHQKLAKNTQISKSDCHEIIETDNIDMIKNTAKVESLQGSQKEENQQLLVDTKYNTDEVRNTKQIKPQKEKENLLRSRASRDSRFQDHIGSKSFSKNTKSKASISSSSSTIHCQNSVSSNSTLRGLYGRHSRKTISKNRDSNPKKSLHKVIKQKAHVKSKKTDTKANLKSKRPVQNDQLLQPVHKVPIDNIHNSVEHVIYDIDDDDDDDYDEQEEDIDMENFVIPGNDGYSNSTYNYLVDEFVTHYEKMSVDGNGDPISFNIDNLRQQMQRGMVKKTGLSRKPVLRSESDEEIINMFRAGSTVNVEQLEVPEDRNNNKNDFISPEPSFEKALPKDRQKKDAKNQKKKVKGDTPRRVMKKEIVIQTSDSDYTDSDCSYENHDPSIFNENSRQSSPKNNVAKNQVDIRVREQKRKNLLENNSMSQKSSIQADTSAAKHISVAETHFGMQLDALANLPTAPNPADLQAMRKKSVGQTTRTKIVSSMPKEAMRAYHSKQIENANFSGGSHVPEKENTEEYQESKTETSIPDSETKRREIKKKTHAKLGMSRKTDSKRKMSRADSALQSITSVASRPGSSKVLLPPIRKTSRELQRKETQSPELYEQEVCPTVMEKPIAIVKPITMAKIEKHHTPELPVEQSAEVEDMPAASIEDAIEEEIPQRPRIYIPESEISILSFTSSFSFSLFSLPNQYKKQNDDVKNAVYKVGRTPPKEATQELLARIPIRDKNKTKVQSKANKVVNGLNKRVLRKVADPKPIARYVKKLDVVKEEYHVEDEVSQKRDKESQLSIADKSQIFSELHDCDTGVSDENLHPFNGYLENPFKHGQRAFASVPIESQMHLPNAESVLIKVQEYV